MRFHEGKLLVRYQLSAALAVSFQQSASSRRIVDSPNMYGEHFVCREPAGKLNWHHEAES
jgi:hypothetical protein